MNHSEQTINISAVKSARNASQMETELYRAIFQGEEKTSFCQKWRAVREAHDWLKSHRSLPGSGNAVLKFQNLANGMREINRTSGLDEDGKNAAAAEYLAQQLSSNGKKDGHLDISILKLVYA